MMCEKVDSSQMAEEGKMIVCYNFYLFSKWGLQKLILISTISKNWSYIDTKMTRDHRKRRSITNI